MIALFAALDPDLLRERLQPGGKKPLASQGWSQAPAIRSSSDCERAHGKPSDEQEDTRHEDERGVAGNLFRQRRERANVQQHAGSDCDKGGTDQAGDRFRGGHLCSVMDAPPGLL
jgi:hypothetical protein